MVPIVQHCVQCIIFFGMADCKMQIQGSNPGGYSLVRASWGRAVSQGMFFGIFVLNRVSILSVFVLNRVSFLGR